MALVSVNCSPNDILSVVDAVCRLLLVAAPVLKLFGNDSRDESFGVDVLPVLKEVFFYRPIRDTLK